MNESVPLSIIAKRLPHAAGLPIPQRMTAGSSGCDVCAALEEPLELLPGSRALIPTGFCFEIPAGYEIQVRPRSGLAVKNGITVLNAPGTIDADYRGEVKVILVNMSPQPFIIRHGDRIAQLVPMRVASHLVFTEREEINGSDRGEGGFGHTGA
ncbi:MAG: dUTP diphosphatase [Chitinispirillaceae bacterium]|nr:dUTP diphosphatase [Chitinispirillaceae bacterium]